jgi:hypothetical protein
MRKWTVALAVASLTAVLSLPANADHRHHSVSGPYVSFGYNYGYGYPFGYGFGYGVRPYSPWYGPYYGPSVGVGVRIDPYRSSRARTEERSSSSGQPRALKMYVYPSAGQSEAQTTEDKYQCHVWAADQSGYDPTNGAGDRDDAESYTRAFTACMEGRNYVVK